MSDGKLERRKKLMAITLEKIGKIVEVLPVFFHTKETINVIGEPGMGKTEILSGEMENLITLEVERVWGGEAEMKKKGFDVKNHYSFIDGSGMPTEAIVIPYINNEAVDHLQRDLIPELKKARRFLADKKNDGLTYVIFIDEFTSFNQSDQRTLMNLIQSGLLPDGTRIDKKRIWFILAGNPAPSIPGFEDSDSPTHEMELAVITRGATFFVAPDVDSFLLWGATASKQWTGEKLVGRSNIHPYLLSALTKNKELYNKKDITDVRVLNSRTAKKLSNYLYGVEDLKAQKKGDHRWQSIVIEAYAGVNIGQSLASTIQHLDSLVSPTELFGDGKTNKISKADPIVKKFEAMDGFEKYYLLLKATEDGSGVDFSNENYVYKLCWIMRNLTVPSEVFGALEDRVLNAPEGTNVKNLFDNKYFQAAPDSGYNFLIELAQLRNLTKSIE